jgi:hypothetical protein
MFCPNCGNKSSLDQKFCRSCGLGLEKVTQTVVEQSPMDLGESLEERKHRLEKWGVLALTPFGLGLLGLILYGIVYNMMIIQGKVLTGLGLLGLMVIIGCGLFSVVLFAKAHEVEQAKTKRRITPAEDLTQVETTRELLPEGRLGQITSVTEHTTELLFAERKGAGKES